MRHSRATVAFVFVTALLDIAAMGIVSPVLPKLIEELTGSNAQAGAINGMFLALWAAMQFAASPAIGSLSDTFGRRPMILLSAIGLAVNYAIMALAQDLWWLALGRIIAGVTSASFTTIYAYMTDITLPQRRSQAFGIIGAAFSAGLIAGPLLGGMLGEISPRAPFWAAGALSTLAFLYGVFFLPESLKPERRVPFSWRRASPFDAIRMVREHKGLAELATVNFLLYFAYYAFSTVFVLYVSFRYHWTAREAGALLAAACLCDMLVQSVMVGPLTRWFGERRIMIFGLFAGAAGIACMGFAPTGALFSLAMVLNALRVLAIPTLRSLMTQKVSASEQGRLQGANMCLASIAGVLAPPFFGFTYSISITSVPAASSYSGAAFVIAAIVMLIAGIGGWRAECRANSDLSARDSSTIPVRGFTSRR